MLKKIAFIVIGIFAFLQFYNPAIASVVVKEIVIQKTYNNDTLSNERIDNCNGNFPSKTVSVTLSNKEALTVEGGYTLTVGGSVNVFGVDIGLSQSIQNKVARTYSSSISHTDSLVLTANPGSKIVHTVKHHRRYVQGHVYVEKTEYLFKKKTKVIPFRYCISYKLSKFKEQEERCPLPYLKIQNVEFFPQSGCQNNFKNYQLVVNVQNLGDRFADYTDIYADIYSYHTKRSQRYPIVNKAYIATGRSNRYQAWATLNCNAFPRGSYVHISFQVHYKLPYNKGNVYDERKISQYRLPY